MAENPVPFTYAKQVGFNLEDVILNTNNEVSFSIPTGRIYGVLGLNTFRKEIRAHYVSHSSDYVDPPSIDIVRPWFSTIRYGEEVSSKGTFKKSLLPPRWRLLMAQIVQCLGGKTGDFDQITNKDGIVLVNNHALKPNQTEGPPFTAHMLAICNAEKPVAFKAPRISSQTEKKVSQGTKPGAKAGNKKQSTSSKKPPMSSNEATKGGSSKAPIGSKASPSRNRKESSSAKDSNPSQPLVSTHVDTGMHKEDRQATGGLTFLRVTSKEGAHPQLSSSMSAFSKLKFIYSAFIIIHTESASGYDALANSKVEADPGTSAFNDSLPPQQDKTKYVSDGLETVLATSKTRTKYAAKPKEEDKNEEIYSTMNDKTEDILAFIPPSLSLHSASKAGDQRVPSVGQASTMPNEREKNTNQATISQLFQRRAKNNTERKNLNKPQSETTSPPNPPIITTITNMQSPFLSNPPESSSQPEGEQTKIDKGKKAMSLKDAKEESTESDPDDNETRQEIEEEAKAEAARREGEIRKKELIDLLGPKMVNKYYNDKLQYDRYCDKMLNRRAKSRITNCDILTRKGPITLKVYRKDDTSKIIHEFKASDLHLGEWREVVTACPKKGKGWTSIYKHIQKKIDYLHTTEAELGIDLDRPLSEQDPLDRLNDLANKKRKHVGDIHDFFRANKRLNSSIQYEDHPAGTVLNEPVMGMILFNSYHKQDFVTIEDFRDFPNTMLYTVQEILFRLHQGPRLDDHARTLVSFCLLKWIRET
nr:hypothetical protein [Tanacetum cinerariifolium]